jgi:hypothetical protein
METKLIYFFLKVLEIKWILVLLTSQCFLFFLQIFKRLVALSPWGLQLLPFFFLLSSTLSNQFFYVFLTNFSLEKGNLLFKYFGLLEQLLQQLLLLPLVVAGNDLHILLNHFIYQLALLLSFATHWHTLLFHYKQSICFLSSTSIHYKQIIHH